MNGLWQWCYVTSPPSGRCSFPHLANCCLPREKPTKQPTTATQHTAPNSARPREKPTKQPTYATQHTDPNSALPGEKPTKQPTSATQHTAPNSALPGEKPTKQPTTTTQHTDPTCLTFGCGLHCFFLFSLKRREYRRCLSRSQLNSQPLLPPNIPTQTRLCLGRSQLNNQSTNQPPPPPVIR